ncbi:MAG TPA: hypothetical protein VNC22_23060 [Sporichthya sp.]|jgi:hypothetical protein|nr:hypothetical protein [Sporichthya sp.]
MARRKSLTASMKIAVTDPNALLRTRAAKSRVDWSRAWDYYDDIGEVHFALNEVGREMSRGCLVAQKRTDEGWETADLNDKAQLLVDGIQSYAGGQGQFLRSYYINTKVTGEVWLVIYEKEGQTWFDMCSPDEIDVIGGAGDNSPTNRIVRRMIPSRNIGVTDTESIEVLPAATDLIRFWNPHPRFSLLGDSPMVAMDVILDELQTLTRALKNKLMSRLAMSGYWFIPNSIQEVGVGVPDGDPTGLTADPLVNKIVKSLYDGMADTNGPGGAAPFILRGPDDAGDKIRIEFPDRELFTAEIVLRDELINRALAGLDIHPQTAKGTQDSNHWSSWSGQEMHINNQIAPEFETLCAGLNKDWYPDALEQIGEDPSAWRIWYELDNLTQRPNLANDARELADRAAISDEGLRMAAGIAEEYAPDGPEKVRLIGRWIRNPYMSTFGMPEQDEFDWEKINPPKGSGPPGGGASPAGPGVGDPGSPDNNQSDTPKGDRPGG